MSIYSNLKGSSGSGGFTLYNTIADLPLSGVATGSEAYVVDTHRLYFWNGAGWYSIAIINEAPNITIGGDASYALANDGTPTVVTLAANDPEGSPIIWSYAVTAGSLGSTATVSQADNVFTITPSTLEADVGSFTLTFTASDGVNVSNNVSEFSLAFSPATFDYLVVGGGGGGGDRHGAGGGAGEYKEDVNIAITAGNVYSVTIGDGGVAGSFGEGTDSQLAPVNNGQGGFGGQSTLVCAAQALSITSYGGGGGGTYTAGTSTATPRGSGGGGAGRGLGGASGVGNGGFVGAGGTGANPGGGGGGGADGNGASGSTGAGGAGKQWVDGNYYAGGGAGGKNASGSTTTIGGIGGGGDGGWTTEVTNGAPNTGGGGGGTRSYYSGVGALGGTGVVILRVPGGDSGPTITGTCVVSSAGGYTYYKFTTDGTIAWQQKI